MSKKQSFYIQNDLIILFILFVCVSLLSIYNAQQLDQYNENFVLKQIVWFTIGVGIVAAIQYLDIEQIQKASVFIYGFGVLVLAVLLISPDAIAKPVNGAKSWFQLPGLSLQPAEFTKITTIIYMAAVIHSHKQKFERPTVKSDILMLVKILAVVGAPVFLIMQQPDFGTAMVYLFIAGMIIILSGIDWKIIMFLIVSISAVLGAVLGFIVKFPDLAKKIVGDDQAYQIDRIMTWFDPTQQTSDATWHFDQAFMALGSGQLFGKGLGTPQVNFPEAQTDFIFSIIGESFGFVGSALVIFLYFMLLYKLVTIGLAIYQHSPFASYICFGYLSMLLVHVFQNVGMAIGIMPVTGIPLLLISYGGSSVLSTMLGFGVIYRIAVENSIQNDYLFK
ncbi:FtsW/RodA/SpoVE family cell cycle protein [Agaribacter marinus]|uniref:Rod shape-determining protein RodA n=1 Tax=Virgibacillus salarius TaxID=447199 RepID=A0A941DVS7_9BACI|nr:FtsW/RodA/SpoVE family cell cycle protein [uncultured Virgibacillus sp.]MBR7798219.1 rod shape-determining protein RodA [Virgibacillus salarius]NAZ10927.1 FtsW/RodA/SpoVE family cell cycle protein [Agaribacter marinus]